MDDISRSPGAYFAGKARGNVRGFPGVGSSKTMTGMHNVCSVIASIGHVGGCWHEAAIGIESSG